MDTGVYIILTAVSAIVLYAIASRIVKSFLKFRGTRVVTCPETLKPVAVEVDTAHAAATAAFNEQPELRLRSCTRWPERHDCDQDCLWQIELAPADCRAETMLRTWYEGRNCVYCHKPFGKLHLLDHKPALLTPEGTTVEWHEIKPERIPEVLATHRPVCWDCHIAESFRREHPELVVDRPRRTGAHV